MALNTRELYLVLKARDEASRAVRNFGSNMSRLGALERKLNSAAAASANQLAAARRRAAEASIKADEARQMKAKEVAAKMAELDKLQAESAAKLTASLAKQTDMQIAIQKLRVDKAAQLAEYQAIINSEMAVSAKERSGAIIAEARLEMAAIRERMNEAIRAGQLEVLAERETRVAIAQASEARIKEATEAVEAAKVRGDAAIAAARKEALAAKTSIAAMKEQSAAQIASIRNAMEAESGRMAAARSRLNVGNAAMTGGVMTAAVGAVGIAALNHMANAAANYRQEVARVATQTDKVKISMDQLEKLGLQTSNSLAVGFDQVQPALYDIFSSIDVNAPQAGKLLRQIGKDAVGGAVDMQTAGQLNIGILNAFKLKVKDASHVSDIMFQLVRKGVGTYKQFGTTIGRAVPSAVKATQSIEGLAGMMAFLTRNGLSAAMASSSAARALDAIANPKTQENFKDFGNIVISTLKSLGGKNNLDTIKNLGSNFKKLSVDVTDGHGKFLPMVDIVHKMNAALSGLNKVQKADVMKELFKSSGGTIQAMRFFNHAVNDSNNLLGEMTTDMYKAKGAAEQAYKIMSNTPEAKIQIMKNQFKALSVEIGNDLLPMKMKLVNVLSRLFGWISNLSPKTKKMIADFLAAAAATAVVIGVITILIGLFLTLEAGITLIVGSLVPAIAAFGEFALAAAAIYLIIKNWSKFKDDAERIWQSVTRMFGPVEAAWNRFYPVFMVGVNQIVFAFRNLITHLTGSKGDLNNIFLGIGKFFATLLTIAKEVWPIIAHTIVGSINLIKPIVSSLITIFSALSTVWGGLPHWAQQVVVAGAIITFAMRANIVQSDLWAASIGRATGSIGRSFRTSAAAGKTMQIAIASIALGMIVGQWAGQVQGAAGKVLAAFSGIATGAMAGFAMGGPWGAAIGGAIGGITSLVTAWGKQGDAAAASAAAARAALAQQKADIDSLYQSLISVDGAYGKIYKDAVAQQLMKNGTLALARKAGVNPNDVVESTLGNTKAQARLDAAAARAAQGTPDYEVNPQTGKKFLAGFIVDKAKIEATQALGNALSKAGNIAKGAEAKWELYAQATGKAIIPQRLLAGGLKNVSKELGNNGVALTNASAYGKQNIAVIKANVAQFQKQYVAQVKSGTGALAAAAGYQANVDALKAQLIQLDFQPAAIQAIIDRMGKLPKNITVPTKVEIAQAKQQIQSLQTTIDSLRQNHAPGMNVGIEAAMQQIALLQWKINSLHGKNVTVGAERSANAVENAPKPHAMGGYLNEGLNTINERGAELLQKHGSSVRVLTHSQSLQFARNAARQANKVNFDPTTIPISTVGTHTVGKGKSAHSKSDYSFGGHEYGTATAAKNAINSLKDSIKNTKIPSVMSNIFGTPKTLKKSVDALLTAADKTMSAVQSKALGKQETHLISMSNKLVSLNKKLATNVTALDNLKTNKSDLASSVSSAISGSFNVGTDLGSFTDMSGDLSQALSDAKTFQKDIGQLKTKGYSDALISQLYGEGPAALPQIESLLSATKGQAKGFQKNWDSLNKIATQTGNTVASNMYDAGINSAQGLINGLNSKIGVLKKTMKTLADTMVNEIKKRLGIKSPSTKFDFVGRMNMKGLDNGHRKGFSFVKQTVQAQMSELTGIYQQNYKPTEMAASVASYRKPGESDSGSGNVTKHFNQKFTVNTQEIDPIKHAADLGWEISRRVH